MLHSNSAQCQRSKIKRSSKNIEKAQRGGKEGGKGTMSTQRMSKQARVCQKSRAEMSRAKIKVFKNENGRRDGPRKDTHGCQKSAKRTLGNTGKKKVRDEQTTREGQREDQEEEVRRKQCKKTREGQRRSKKSREGQGGSKKR